jgi:hypothetical protein
LSSSRHRQQEGAFDQTVKKRPDDPDGFAAMVEGGREIGPAVAELLRDLLDLSSRGHEDRHPPALPHDPLYETIVQELERLFRYHVDLSRPCWIKSSCLEDLGG